jgi:hypothetical protein
LIFFSQQQGDIVQAIIKFLATYHAVIGDLVPQHIMMLCVSLSDKVIGIDTTIDNLTTRCNVNKYAIDSLAYRTGYISVQGKYIILQPSFFKDFQIVPEELNMQVVYIDRYVAPEQPIVRTEQSPPAIMLTTDQGEQRYIELVPAGTVVEQSKPIELINNTKALSTLTQTLMDNADKKATSRKAAPKQKAVQEGSTNPVIVGLELFDELYRGKFPELPPPKHSVKDRTNLKELADHFGGKVLADTIQWFFSNYDDLKKKYNWTYPSVGLFYGFRNSIFPSAIKNDKITNDVKWGSHHKETNDRDDGDEVGFGIKLDDE